MPKTSPTASARVLAHATIIDILAVAQAASATAIADTVAPIGTDADGWIECSSYSLIHVTATAVGAGITVTAQVKTTAGAPPIALSLVDGVLAADTSEVILDDVIKAGFIRFLAAGTVGGGNTMSLHVLLK
jgi:hypothetical protein